MSTAGGVTTARLDASALESLLDFVVQPSGLGDPEHDLLMVLEGDGSGYTYDIESVSVPEPGSLALAAFGAGCVAAPILRRRWGARSNE